MSAKQMRYVCVRVRVHMCMCACVRAHVCVCRVKERRVVGLTTEQVNLSSVNFLLQTAFESIDNIYNVTTFGLQDTFYQRYKRELHRPHLISLALSIVYGITYGFSQSAILFAYIIAFRFGAFQVTLDPDHVLYTDFENVYRVFGAIIFGSLAIGAATAFAPNYSQAKQAAARVFAIIDRVSLIDSSLEEGYEILDVRFLPCPFLIFLPFFSHSLSFRKTLLGRLR